MNPNGLSDQALLDRLVSLAKQERENTAEVVAHLAETERRDLARQRGFSSLFEYCIKVLKYSEPSAYRQIRAARAVAKKPELLDMLRNGEIHLQAIVLLHPHLETEQAEELISQVKGKTKREVEAIVSPLNPLPPCSDSVKLIAVSAQRASEGLPLFEQSHSRDMPIPEPEQRVQVSFSAKPEFMNLLRRAQDLLWHKYPDGCLEGIFEDALLEFLSRKDPMSWSTPKPGTSTDRSAPRWVRHAVWKRDGGRCTFQAPDGRRCDARAGLEFDHITPWAFGGSSNDQKNIRLLCHGHNQLKAKEAGLDRLKP